MTKILPKDSPTSHGLTKKVVLGGAWISGRLLVTSFLNLGVMAILARQLKPADFGLIALSSVIMRFLVVLGAEGVSEFVIYDNQEGREERVQSAFWMDLTFASACVLIGLLFVPYITNFYTEPLLATILTILFLRYLIDTSNKVPDALLKKRLDFQKLVIRDTILEIFTSLSSVLMALSGFGIWSLVFPGLVSSLLRTIIVFRLAHWIPRFRFHIRNWPQIFSYSANVIGGTFTSLVITDGDTLLVGKVLGSTALGVYNLAYMAANLVTRNVTGIVNKLAFPTLSSISGNIDQLRDAVKRMLLILSLVTFPLLIGLFVIADDFILTLYGSQWRGAILPLRIMIIFTLRHSVGTTSSALFKAVGRTDISFKLGAATIPFYLISIWLGAKYGIVGVAIAITLVRTLFGLIGFEMMGRCLKQSFWQVISPMVPAFMVSFWMGGVVYLVNLFLDPFLEGSNLLSLIISIAIGGLTYLILLRTIYRKLAEELARVTAPMLGPLQVLVIRALNIKPI